MKRKRVRVWCFSSLTAGITLACGLNPIPDLPEKDMKPPLTDDNSASNDDLSTPGAGGIILQPWRPGAGGGASTGTGGRSMGSGGKASMGGAFGSGGRGEGTGSSPSGAGGASSAAGGAPSSGGNSMAGAAGALGLGGEGPPSSVGLP